MRDEIDHAPLQHRPATLSVCHADPRFGDEPGQEIRDRSDRPDAVVNEVDLAAPRQFRANRAGDDLGDRT